MRLALLPSASSGAAVLDVRNRAMFVRSTSAQTLHSYHMLKAHSLLDQALDIDADRRRDFAQFVVGVVVGLDDLDGADAKRADHHLVELAILRLVVDGDEGLQQQILVGLRNVA